MRHAPIFCAVATVAAMTGCTASWEKDFGGSVRQMIAGQTQDQTAPHGQQVIGLDGQKAAQAIEDYRRPPTANNAGTASAISGVLITPSQ